MSIVPYFWIDPPTKTVINLCDVSAVTDAGGGDIDVHFISDSDSPLTLRANWEGENVNQVQSFFEALVKYQTLRGSR